MDELAQSAMDAVTDGRVKIIPERYAKGYLDWLSEKRDWPIGRQLWWGHRIPVWTRMQWDHRAASEEMKAFGRQLTRWGRADYQCALRPEMRRHSVQQRRDRSKVQPLFHLHTGRERLRGRRRN